MLTFSLKSQQLSLAVFSIWAAAVTFTQPFSQGLSLTFKDWRKLEERKGVSQSRWDWSVPHWFLWVQSKGIIESYKDSIRVYKTTETQTFK